VIAAMVATLAYAGLANAATINISTTAQLENTFSATCTTTISPCAQSGDTVVLAAGNYSPGAPLTINLSNLTIAGPQTGFPGVVVSGTNDTAGTQDIFDIGPAASVTIQNVSIRGASSGATGAVVVDGSLDLENSDAQGNNNIVLKINGNAVVRNSTIALNTFAASAAAADVTGDLKLFDDTINGNDVGVFLDGGTVEATNTIVSNNGGGDCPGGGFSSSVRNLDTDGTCGAQITANPRLSNLQANGGSTQNYALLAGSPAIDAGSNAPGDCPPVDQRYAPRTDGHCDIGAYEVQVADTTPPQITVPSDITAEATGPGGAAVTYTATATDNVGVTSFSCTPASGSTFPLGTTTVNCSASDAAGNTSTASFHVTVRDTTPPVVTVPADISDTTTSPSGKAETFTASASDSVDGPITPTCSPASGSVFPVGSTTVTCTATDAHGNTGSASFHVAIAFNDTTPPQITVPSDITAEATGPGGAAVTYTATATDNVGVRSFSCTPASGSTFPLGTTTVNCSASDAAGNTSTASFHVTVHDTTPPAITVPANITMQATDSSGVVVTYTAPTATDLVDGPVTPTCTSAPTTGLSSGSKFPVGTTTITCTATDAHANTATKSFAVTVTQQADTTPPVITVPSDITAEATGPGGAPVTYTATATDNVGVTSFSCTPASGSTFPLGTTAVNCSASDAAGNTAAASFHVTVQDTTGPVVTVPANIADTTTDPFGKVETFTVSAADAVDGSEPAFCDPASGTKFPVGVTTVICNASDSRGNASTNTFTVTITRNTPAVINVSTTAQLENVVGTLVAGDQIVLAAGNYTPATPLDLKKNVTITGPQSGAPGAVIAGTNVSPTCATCPDDVVIVEPGVTATIANVSVRLAPSDGAGVDVFGTLALNNSDLQGSNANALVSENGASVTITNTTIAVNGSAGIDAFGDVRLFNDTIAGNVWGVFLEGTGTTSATNTIVANNTHDCNTALTSGVASLDRDGSCGFPKTANPLLGPLGFNGGSTQSYALLAHSPAIDAGTSAGGACPTVDQRYVARDAVGCDIGAYEYVDTTAPVITVPADITAEATGPGGANVTYSTSATDDVAVATLSCSPASGAQFPLGTTTVTCNATDTHGNTSSKSFQVTVVDTTPPTLVNVPADVTAEATGASGATVSYTNPTATDLVDGTTDAVSCTPASGSTFPLGTTTVHCSAKDAAGNTGTASFHVTVVDTTPPTISNVPADITAEATGPTGAMVTFTNPTATDLVDGPVVVACTPASGSTFGLGTTTVHCTATDGHGNTASASFHVTVHDTTPPAITVPSDLTVEATGPSGAAVSYTANATDAVGVTSFSCSPASGSTFPVGTTTVTCTAKDAAGNTSTASFHVTVRDTTPPAITVPANITVPATGSSGAVVSYTAPTAADLVDGPITPTCTSAPTTGLSSGSTFPVGTTTITCTATDAHGNTATKSFTVTVTQGDTTPPVISVPSDITAEATGPGGAVVSYTATATDNVGVTSFSCSPASGSTFHLGTTTVTCTASDAAGNTSTASFQVTVQDTTPPTLSGVPANITIEATGPSGAAVTFTKPTANDLVDGPVPVTCDHSSGSTFPLGTTTVTCTATDSHGNSKSASFTVTVRDTTPPSITVPANITDTTTDSTGKVETYTAPTATDLVDGSLTPTCTSAPTAGLSSGSKFPVGTTTITCTATDAHGNSASKSFTVAITLSTGDHTPPVLTVPANIKVNATSPAGAVVTYTVTATDPDNPPSQITIVCTPASGSTFPINSNGTSKTTTVTCNAHDPAGNNAAPKSFTVTVFGVYDQLVALGGQVNAATNLSKGTKQSLEAQLLNAGVAYALGSKSSAKSDVNQFIKKVNQDKPPITSAQATAWIASANQIIAVIGS
jgi:hypothetical protein